jgi:ElaB/YqjD/DUF883 family membrane-anchored ribosome-binding protein
MANTQIVPRTKNKVEIDEQRLPAEEEIRRTREQIAATTSQIQMQVRSNLSWRQWVNRYPLAVVSIATTTGFLIGSALPSSDRRNVKSNSRGKGNQKRDQELIEETGKNTLVATVLTNVALNVLREGSSYLARRFFSDK